MRTKITELLGIQYPIIQGAMAWIAEHNLAAAVSLAGGLGIIAAGNAPIDVVRNEIRKTKEMTDKPFGVNIMMISPYADQVAEVVCEENVSVVITGAGTPPDRYMKMFKEKGIKILPVVASTAVALKVIKNGADAVICEGCEAGGHIGELTTMALVPQVIDAVNVPVVAAGGIGDGRGLAAAFMLGAEGVQIGTRFVVAEECIVHRNYKEKILKARDIDTIVTGRSTGHPVRSLKNQMTREYLKMEKEGIGFEELENLTVGSLKNAVVDGEVATGSLMSGQIAGLIKKEQSCSEIINEIMGEALQVYKDKGQLFLA